MPNIVFPPGWNRNQQELILPSGADEAAPACELSCLNVNPPCIGASGGASGCAYFDRQDALARLVFLEDGIHLEDFFELLDAAGVFPDIQDQPAVLYHKHGYNLGIGVDGKVKAPGEGGKDQFEFREVLPADDLLRVDQVECLRRNAIVDEQLPRDLKGIISGGGSPKGIVEAMGRFFEIGQIKVGRGLFGEVPVEKDIDGCQTATDVEDVGRGRWEGGGEAFKIPLDTPSKAVNNGFRQMDSMCQIPYCIYIFMR
jgi:hypothetical protein